MASRRRRFAFLPFLVLVGVVSAVGCQKDGPAPEAPEGGGAAAPSGPSAAARSTGDLPPCIEPALAGSDAKARLDCLMELEDNGSLADAFSLREAARESLQRGQPETASLAPVLARVDEVFDSASFGRRVEAQLAGQLNDDVVRGLLTFRASELGQRENQAQLEDLDEAAFEAWLNAFDPEGVRAELVGDIAEATELVGFIEAFILTPGIGLGRIAFVLQSGRTPSDDEMAKIREVVGQELAEPADNFAQALWLVLAHAYRDLSDDDVTQIAEYYRSDASRAYHAALVVAVNAVVAESLAAIEQEALAASGGAGEG